MKHRAVLLDAGATLFTERRTRDDLYAEVLATHGLPLPLEQVAAWRAEEHDAMPDVADGHVRYSEGWFREFIARLLRRGGCDADPEAVRAELAAVFVRPDTYAPYPDTVPALEALRASGRRLAVASNWSDHLPSLLDGLGLARWFDVVVASQAIGAAKPDARLFEATLRQLGVAPGEALHVGDHPVNDLQGARDAGLDALLLDRSERRAGAHVVHALTEVPAHLT